MVILHYTVLKSMMVILTLLKSMLVILHFIGIYDGKSANGPMTKFCLTKRQTTSAGVSL